MPRKLFGWMPVRAAGWITATLSSLALCQPALAQKQVPDERDGDDQRLVRPAGGPLRVKNVPPQLLKILKDWEKSSANVKKLDGEHTRMEYDYVFGVMKKNLGKFYYESPDKGRIDLNPAVVNAGQQVIEKKHWQNGKLVKFKVQAGQSEKWICNGKSITQIDDKAKTALQMKIPPDNQGARIMDGPLPFLFGMPAEKAIRRFDLDLVGITKNGNKQIATIRATPNEPQDAANYQKAEINLNLETFLPEAVRLIDPAGTKETVFVFMEVEANPRRFGQWFGANPFDPSLRGYKLVRPDMNGGRADQDPNDQGIVPVASKSAAVPSVIDLDWKQAKATLEKLGFTVSFERGSIAKRDDQINRIEQQDPSPKSKLALGESVTLKVYTKPKPKE